jgi:DNA-binding Lrp family transcriptional regulator
MRGGMMQDSMKKIAGVVQTTFPLEREPFSALAAKLSMGEEEVIRGIARLKEEGIVRQISPIFDTRMLGYESTLAAFRVAPRHIEAVAGSVSAHPGVSHNYERDGDFNLWFTLAVPPDSTLGIEGTARLLAGHEAVERYVILSARRVFKVRVRLDLGEKSNEKLAEKLSEKEEVRRPEQTCRPLTDDEKEIVRVTQQDMPLVKRPFLRYAETLGVTEDYLIGKLRGFRDRGVMRRFAAVLHHRRAGYKANGMVVWKVPEERVEEVGLKKASYTAVSHCYERTTNGHWHYNLFTMVHGRSVGEVEEIVGTMSDETGIKDFKIIYSLREFKKVRLRYFTEDFSLWEKSAFLPDDTEELSAG